MNEAALPKHGEWAVVLLSVVSQQLHLHVLHKVIVLPLNRELVQPPALRQLKHPQGVVLFGGVPAVLKYHGFKRRAYKHANNDQFDILL